MSFTLPTELLEKDAASNKDRDSLDLELWHTWKKSDEHPDHLKPLMKQFEGVRVKSANKWKSVDMPFSVIKAEHDKQFLKALRTFEPDKGRLGTWIGHSLDKNPQRYLTTYQNPHRIIENRTGAKKGLFDNAVATLDDQLGRPATTQELSEHLGWHPAEIERAQAENRKSLYTSVNPYGLDPATNMPSRATEIARFIKTELTPEEMLVWEHTTGDGGKEQLKPGEIAKKLKLHPSKVTRIRNAISDKIKKYY